MENFTKTTSNNYLKSNFVTLEMKHYFLPYCEIYSGMISYFYHVVGKQEDINSFISKAILNELCETITRGIRRLKNEVLLNVVRYCGSYIRFCSSSEVSNNRVLLISMELFTFSSAKHQNHSLSQLLSLNGPKTVRVREI